MFYSHINRSWFLGIYVLISGNYFEAVYVLGGLSLFVSGASYTWATPLLPELKSSTSEFRLSADEGSWVISLIEIGNLIPCIPAGFVVDRYGRKPCLLYATPCYILTWLFVLWYKSVPALYFMRMVQGLAMSVQFTVLPMYLAEVASPSRRGALGSLFQIMWYLGFLYEYVLGAFFKYDALTIFSLVPPVVFMMTFCFCPESPYFLLMRNRNEEAAETLAWLRGLSVEEVGPELESIYQSIEEEKKEEGSWRDVLGTACGRKGLGIMLVLGTAYIMSGLPTVLCYLSEIFGTASGNQEEANFVTIMVGVAVLVATFLSTCLLDRLGRRPIVICSSAVSSLFLIATAIYYYYSEMTQEDMSSYSWVPYVTIFMFSATMSIMVGAIPPLQGEMFPNCTRGIACGIYTFYITVLSFGCLKLYQVIGDGLGYYIDYIIFSGFTLFGTVFMFFFLPETKGKTFAEIQTILGKS